MRSSYRETLKWSIHGTALHVLGYSKVCVCGLLQILQVCIADGISVKVKYSCHCMNQVTVTRDS